MAKKTLNLTVEENIKKRAKRIASHRGISVSDLFEELILKQVVPEEFNPRPGSGVEQIMNAISEKQRSVDYDEIKLESLKEKYGLRQNTD